ncbi:uncharacterized protein LOC110440228 [Mizuhopecten yessoensis]|uniref:uncharacterized protein LOC110440228 n=1 Tax=Mizuhopecten yessoensis TaxID=6573 RepID=UPI000B45CFD9|nr:uncharacterized protein LOC110440228 [Mizuhopecten yessoensis]XP_021356444.1 uncharacterized protein LOC110440228 [Mizuhopecten yessoensis]
MLRAVAFQNFIKFRKHQSLEFQDGPNFIVGPNASGKSAIFELIRRCDSNTANSSISTVADINNDAFVICKFEIRQKLSDKLPKGCHVYSCVFIPHSDSKEMNKPAAKDTKQMYKLVCITYTDKKREKCYLDHYPSIDKKVISFCNDSTKLSCELDGLIKSGISDVKLDDLIQKFKELESESDISECESVLQAIHGAVVVTFPIRSPGPIQWSHSRNIGEGNEHYDAASNKAEILQELLESEDVDMEKANQIYQTIIRPLKYKFEMDGKSRITVNDGETDIRFLKVPEGIIEAKQFALMYAHRNYQTLVLEEPGRGMHLHMIQKLRDLVFRTHTKDQGKVLLLTTHHTAMINHWSMSRMFICRRTRNADGIVEHRVVKLNEIKKIYELEDILKEMVFSEAILFVEGFTDKKVIRSVFDRVLEAEHIVGLTEPQLTDFQQMAARTQIISIGGSSNHERITTLTEISERLKIPCTFLFDRDKKFHCKAELHLAEHDANRKNKARDANWKKSTHDANRKDRERDSNWKNKASFCARTLFKRRSEYCKENPGETGEQKVESDNFDDVMKVLLNMKNNDERYVNGKHELGFEGDIEEVETTKVISFIRRVVLPEPLEQEAEKNTEEDAEKTQFIWKSGHLEDVICKSILGDQTEVQQSTASTSNQTDFDVAFLIKMFVCKDHEGKNPIKETLKHMNIQTAQTLSTYLLKRGEMRTFLQFLSDIEKPNLKIKTTK